MSVNEEAKSLGKPLPTVGLIGLHDTGAEIVTAAFHQFGIEALILSGDVRNALQTRKLEGCVVRLEENAEELLETLRNSARNRYIPILGVCGPNAEMRRYAKYGLNAVLKEPLDRQECMKAVRGIQLLILHELRRYVRIPIVLEVVMKLEDGASHTALTRDISYGGMSIECLEKISPGHAGEFSFALPNGTFAQVAGAILWRHHPQLLGVRFVQEDERRAVVRRWIDEYFHFF